MTNFHLSGRRLATVGGVAMLALAAVIAVMAISANAASPTIGVKNVKVGGKSEPIAVNSKGVHGLHTERRIAQAPGVHQPMACFAAWPPVTVKGKPSISGVKGKLGTLKRDGFTQVTLSGHPLYTFEGDGNKAGVANGNGIVAFGGTWHVVVAGSAQSATAPGGGGGGAW